LNSSAKYIAYDWQFSSFSFLPDYYPGLATEYGFNQWVYMITGTSFGGAYAAEPVKTATNR
jgi:hypothetical protein